MQPSSSFIKKLPGCEILSDTVRVYDTFVATIEKTDQGAELLLLLFTIY